MKRIFALVLALLLCLITLSACSEADKVNTNLSKQADYFECERKITVYKKNYIYLNDYTLYVVEDITGTHTDPYHYQLYFHTEVLPTVEARP